MNGRRIEYPKIGIVIPVFNRLTCTIACLESLKKVKYPNVEIIIIDDGSTDGTYEVISKAHPYVVLLKGDGNLWWSEATNMGVRRAMVDNCEYVLFLNNDDEVEDSILYHLALCAKDNPKSIIGCKVRNYDRPNMLVFAGGDCDWERKGLFTYGYGEKDEGQHDTRRDIKWIPGAGTFVKVDVFLDIGLIDDRAFPHYAADIDFTLRAYESGYRIIFEPNAVLYKKMGVNRLSSNRNYSILQTLIMPLFIRRSSINLCLQAKFLWRHCPKKYVLKIFILKYYNYYKGIIKMDNILRYLFNEYRNRM